MGESFEGEGVSKEMCEEEIYGLSQKKKKNRRNVRIFFLLQLC